MWCLSFASSTLDRGTINVPDRTAQEFLTSLRMAHNLHDECLLYFNRD